MSTRKTIHQAPVGAAEAIRAPVSKSRSPAKTVSKARRFMEETIKTASGFGNGSSPPG
ncbi:MAG: hypothetical protein NNA21_03865 [Nitrospira sp.]|nr:hypothetical protein [Nitrospira sp.]